ncbi:hypothetical protein SBF1_7890003 [Candidatus Desulfosporosinus infrequens]|uniref:Uncharacterized protein n=1 Tax=Candidatus Desulfosporosinus infrequens TaxID=2043169 RepID=A0A2U3LRY8_9FIRM|nr:hypothetical protein SBF1_7890003 [Candidatus Desulfosporosinus infrequens]
MWEDVSLFEGVDSTKISLSTSTGYRVSRKRPSLGPSFCFVSYYCN